MQLDSTLFPRTIWATAGFLCRLTQLAAMAEAEAGLFADGAQQLDVPQAIQAQLLEERAAVASGKAISAQKLVYLEQAAQCHRQANSIMQVSLEVRRVMARAALSVIECPIPGLTLCDSLPFKGSILFSSAASSCKPSRLQSKSSRCAAWHHHLLLQAAVNAMLQSAAARQEASQALEAATEATTLSSSRQKESANHNARCMAPLAQLVPDCPIDCADCKCCRPMWGILLANTSSL